jgi:general secretion pathway protein K
MTPTQRRSVPTRTPPGARPRRAPQSRREGFALLLALIALTLLAVLVADLHETTGTSFAAAVAERDQLRAEYMARSGVNLTRMLIAQERPLRLMVSPIYQMIFKRPAPQLPVWQFADMVLKPFADFEGSKEDGAGAGFDMTLAEGLGKTGGTFEIRACAENGKINLNDPKLKELESSRNSVASLLYGLLGGNLPSPNKFDPLFSQFDEKGRLSSRLDLVANVIDWWDPDEQRTSYDPTLNVTQSAGGEDADYYRDQPEPYSIKNAAFDTLEELRLVRGMSDDVWATFVEPDLEDPRARQVTIWGGNRSSINPNEADPAVLLARVCTFAEFRTQPLCADPSGTERIKFITLMGIARLTPLPIPFFSKANDFVNFITGQPGSLYEDANKAMSSGMGAMFGLGGGGMPGGGSQSGGNSALFTPLVIPPNNTQNPNLREELRRMFTTNSRFFTIESTGKVGHAQRRIRSVVSVDPDWVAPKPNAGKLPPLGIFAYYRIE